MARPQLSEETIEQLARFVEDEFRVDIDQVGVDRQLQVLLERHQQLLQAQSDQLGEQQVDDVVVGDTGLFGGEM